jgi:hypothetical protein
MPTTPGSCSRERSDGGCTDAVTSWGGREKPISIRSPVIRIIAALAAAIGQHAHELHGAALESAPLLQIRWRQGPVPNAAA